PPLILFTLITRSATLMYWVGIKGVVFITRVAGLRVRVEGRENIPAGVCMFAANHTSNADAAAIVGAIPRRLAIFGRKSLFDIPIVGLAFRLAKFVPVDRGNREAALASVKQAIEYMNQGYSFLVYPEGTRSMDGRLQRFKKGAFVMAIEAGVPIVPVICTGAHRVMRKKSLVIHPGKVTVRFAKPIDAASYTIDRRDELARRVHAVIAEELPEDQKPLP
ncbi:MAG TPA: lysophospholipid acyltransferase family protein, partial [Candidatus Dormibacteraeota bacterium]|nr:lysophospholipid acyltransferase family protein [Candidatus Dormibacteraeota bacterium]